MAGESLEFTGADFAPAAEPAAGGGTDAPVATSAQPEGATTPPADTATSTQQTVTPAVQTPSTPQGPIPFDVHHKALENARTKAVEEYRARVGWAEQISQQEYQQIRGLSQRLHTDPIAAISELIGELNQNPTHAQALRSMAARALSAARGQGEPALPEPDLAVTDAQGNVISRAYSAESQAKRDEWLISQVLAKVDERYAPVVKTHAEVAAEREQFRREAIATQWKDGFQQEMSQYPGFAEHKAAIGQEVARMLQQFDPNDPRTEEQPFLEALTLRAYNRVVVPKLQTAERQTVLRDLHHQANAGSVNPARTGVPAQKTFEEMSIAEALEYESKRLGAGVLG